jgi:hypothetical protein
MTDEIWGGVGRVLAAGTAGVATAEQTGSQWLGYLMMAVAFLAFETAMLMRRRRLAVSNEPYPRRPVHPDVLAAIETSVADALDRAVSKLAGEAGPTGEGKGKK